jgi:hypothetical protein
MCAVVNLLQVSIDRDYQITHRAPVRGVEEPASLEHTKLNFNERMIENVAKCSF